MTQEVDRLKRVLSVAGSVMDGLMSGTMSVKQADQRLAEALILDPCDHTTRLVEITSLERELILDLVERDQDNTGVRVVVKDSIRDVLKDP